MRRTAIVAGILAALLTIAGCSVSNGPSEADVAAVEEALGTLPEGWRFAYVDGRDSSSEGLSRNLSIGVEVVSKPAPADVRAVLKSVLDAVPSGASYLIEFTVRTPTAERRLPDLSAEYREIGLGALGGDHGKGSIYATRSEIAKGLEATS